MKLEVESVSLISRMVEVGRFSRNSVDHVLDWCRFKYLGTSAYPSLDPQARPPSRNRNVQYESGLSLAQIIQNHYEIILPKDL
jgi:hypothetical protein